MTLLALGSYDINSTGTVVPAPTCRDQKSKRFVLATYSVGVALHLCRRSVHFSGRPICPGHSVGAVIEGLWSAHQHRALGLDVPVTYEGLSPGPRRIFVRCYEIPNVDIK